MTDPIWTAQELIDKLIFKARVFESDRSDAKQEALISARDACIAEVERLREALADPAAVHVNMLRGTIARPSVRNIWHLYGEEALLAEAPDDIRAALSQHRKL